MSKQSHELYDSEVEYRKYTAEEAASSRIEQLAKDIQLARPGAQVALADALMGVLPSPSSGGCGCMYPE